MLERYGIDSKKMDVEKMENDYRALLVSKMKIQNQYKSEEKNIEKAETQLNELQKYMGIQKKNTFYSQFQKTDIGINKKRNIKSDMLHPLNVSLQNKALFSHFTQKCNFKHHL